MSKRKRFWCVAALALLLASLPSTALASCREVRVTGPVRHVTCSWTGRCVGYIWSGNGSNATQVQVSGWRWREGQTVTKRLFLCGL